MGTPTLPGQDRTGEPPDRRVSTFKNCQCSVITNKFISHILSSSVPKMCEITNLSGLSAQIASVKTSKDENNIGIWGENLPSDLINLKTFQ